MAIKKDDDSFTWRTQGKKFEIGEEGEGGIYDMIVIDGNLLCVTPKNIYSIRLADSVDPKRVNSGIPDMQQKVLGYGSNEPFVGRTLIQAKALLGENALVTSVDSPKGLGIALSFLKEIASLHELRNTYIAEEDKKNTAFEGKLGDDGSLRLPSMDNLEQRVKQFVISIDHASRHLMETIQLFYPDIKNKEWSNQLRKKFSFELSDETVSQFVDSMCSWIWLMRNLRNAVEHPKQEDRVEVQDYKLIHTGKVTPPTLAYAHSETPLAEVQVSRFMSDAVENLLTCFETSLAILCNIHAKAFAGDIRSVIQVPKEQRRPGAEHTRFGFHIAWTR